ncbi:hypothetical protein N7532_010051 [Penicillium argentinense]|uniref:C3H1-type domain-containing protein n=1 Tax=Penicillium argentinense TaxID=1131581 RepID=A0A9W9EP13_9EURO|nr:uncharacterized protein N7532_010051 [Penicillium argentinense]KAJ5085280.1 hypothetical protein N7532_010051 [Penicillium argentinense]
MTENEELLARIGQLAGRINQHKNQQSQQNPHQSQHVSRHASTHQGWAPYSRGRGGRRPPAPHRHRTLVLNNGHGSTASSTPSPTPATDNNSETRPPTTSSGWVAKRDRHMQLINAKVYDKETQARAKAMEETRKAKVLQRAQREQTKVLRYAQGAAGASSVASTAQPVAHQILVNDTPFQIARGGSKLIRMDNDPNKANTTPKRVTVAGVAFVRSKHGNLHRLGAVTSKTTPNPAKKKNELCKRFTTTGLCYKGPSCLYVHDPNKVAICKDFLQTGQCSAGNSCDLSHEPSPHRSPFCLHFLRGRCANPECRYAHIRVTPGAPVCRAFATLGYCEKGAECTERHVHECPNYANTGSCNKRRCKLPHVDRAGQIRAAAAAAANRTEEDSDPSSEEEDYDAIDSDDVDSDEFEEPELVIGGEDTGEVSEQQDFIHL